MSTTLELKIRIRELEARVKALEGRFESTAVPYTPQPPYVVEDKVDFKVDFEVPTVITEVPVAPKYKLCPKCGVKPAYFFHVRSCRGKKQEEKTHGDDGNRSTGGS
jgi:hypothetical protein